MRAEDVMTEYVTVSQSGRHLRHPKDVYKQQFGIEKLKLYNILCNHFLVDFPRKAFLRPGITG